MAREISRKITESIVTGGAKRWFGQLVSISVKDGKEITPAPVMPLYTVIGFIHGAKPGASEYGEFIKFHGQFRATNAADGVVTDAPTLILPNFLADSLWSAVNMPGRSGPIQVALKFGVRYDASSNTKYKFVVEDLMPPSEHDPLAMLTKAVETGTPLLLGGDGAPAPAPAPTEPPAPTPTPAPAPARGKRK